MSRELNYADALRGFIAPDSMINFNPRVDGFHILLAEIVRRSPRAYVRPDSTEPDSSALGSDSLSIPGVSTPEDFDNSNRWLLQRLRMQDPRPSQAPLR
jgi:hypothetical protein